MDLLENETLRMVVIAVVLYVLWQNFSASGAGNMPERMPVEENVGASEEAEELGGVEEPIAVMAEEAPIIRPPMGIEAGMVEGVDASAHANEYLYFKPNGDMGDLASSQNGLITSSLGGQSHRLDACNRFYCEGCGYQSCTGMGSHHHDTDDIRRNYAETINSIRVKRGDDGVYPLYRLS